MDLTAANTLPATATAERSRTRDRNLQIARCLDWRYLLPDPRLRKVTFIGRPGGMLIEALQVFSDKVIMIASCDQRMPTAPENSDVAVVRSCEVGALPLASSVLRTGGYLYWELGATRWRFSLRRCLTALRKQGFDEIGVYGCRPNFEECQEMIPLREPSALAFALSQRFAEGTRRWVLQAAGRLLASTDIPARLMPCRSIVARKARERIRS